MPRRLPDQPQQPAAPEPPPLVDPTAVTGAPGPAGAPAVGPSMGEDSWLLMDPEVSQIAHAAITGGWNDPQRVRAALEATTAYAEINERRQAFASPDSQQAARDDLALQVSYMLGRRAPGDPLVADVAGRLERGEATMAAVRSLVAPMQVGTPAARVVELAAMHGIPMSRQSAEQWTRWSEPDLNAQLGELSQQMFPWKPPAVPFQQVATMFADLHEQELGRQVGTTDPRLNDLIAQAGGNLGRFRQILRQLPEWEHTPTGQAMIAQRTEQVMQHFLDGDAFDETAARDDAGAFGQPQAVAGMAPVSQQSAPLSGAPSPPGMLQASPSTIPATGAAAAFISGASQYLGADYVWGGESLEEGGFDCSGLVQTAAASVGIKLPRTSREQAKVGTPVSMADARAGDLLFWADGGTVHHVAIYLGDGRMIAAPHRGAKVRVQEVYGTPFARRILDGGGAALAGAAGAPTGQAGTPEVGGLGGPGVADALAGGADFALQSPPGTGPPAAGFAGMPGATTAAAGGDWQATLSPAERWILTRESSLNPAAKNPKSSAFGLGQLLLDNRLRYLGADYATTDPYKQLAAFRAYVADRYGTAERAMAFWRAHNWY